MPAIRTFSSLKFIITQPSELVPSISGTHSKFAALSIFQLLLPFGLNSSGSININLEKKLCQAVSVITSIGR